jgi:hypothetical protein
MEKKSLSNLSGLTVTLIPETSGISFLSLQAKKQEATSKKRPVFFILIVNVKPPGLLRGEDTNQKQPKK